MPKLCSLLQRSSAASRFLYCTWSRGIRKDMSVVVEGGRRLSAQEGTIPRYRDTDFENATF